MIHPNAVSVPKGLSERSSPVHGLLSGASLQARLLVLEACGYQGAVETSPQAFLLKLRRQRGLTQQPEALRAPKTQKVIFNPLGPCIPKP